MRYVPRDREVAAHWRCDPPRTHTTPMWFWGGKRFLGFGSRWRCGCGKLWLWRANGLTRDDGLWELVEEGK